MSEFENLSPEDAEYILNLPYHLASGNMADDLCELLTEFEFLLHKVSTLDPQQLIEDYELTASAHALRLLPPCLLFPIPLFLIHCSLFPVPCFLSTIR